MSVPDSPLELRMQPGKPARQCGSCGLCCKLVPVASIEKPAGVKCRHQRHGKGCMIYAQRPPDCVWWNCRWLVNDATEQLPRPDRSHLVIDIMPDFISAVYEDGNRIDAPVIQVWCDPAFREAWREPAMMAYIERMADERRHVTIIRFNSEEAIVVLAPSMCDDHEWHFVTPQLRDKREAMQYRLAAERLA